MGELFLLALTIWGIRGIAESLLQGSAKGTRQQTASSRGAPSSKPQSSEDGSETPSSD